MDRKTRAPPLNQRHSPVTTGPKKAGRSSADVPRCFFEEARERLRRDGALSHLQLDRPKFGAELEPAWESATAHADWFEFQQLEHDPHDSVERWVVGSFFWALLDRARDAAPDGSATENTVQDPFNPAQ